MRCETTANSGMHNVRPTFLLFPFAKMVIARSTERFSPGSQAHPLSETRRFDGTHAHVRMYHICLASPRRRHGKRRAPETPVLRNLSKGREGRL